MTVPELGRPMLRHMVGLLFVMLTAVGSGCATVSHPPFQQFAEAVQQLRTGMDASLSVVYDATRERALEDVAGGAALTAALLTAPPNDPFGWESSSPPLFLTVARFRDGVHRLNSSLVDYAGVMSQLASPDLLKPETFTQLATDLNGNLRTALPALGVTAPPNREIAIFSTVATAAFRAYLQNKQRSGLIEAIAKNQDAIESAAGLGRDAMALTVRAVRSEYDLKSTALANAIASAGGASEARRAKARELLELNDRFVKDLSVLRTMHQSYASIPAAHRELAAAAADPKLGVATIRRLYEEGRDLQRLYEELAKQDAKKK